MDIELRDYIDFIQYIVIAQFLVFVLYSCLLKSLKKKEATGAIVMDPQAAAVNTKQ